MGTPETGVILAAGMGTRLGPRGQTRPKGFLRLGERPIVEESLEKLRAAGMRRVLIVTGHCHDAYDELARNSGGFIRTVHNARYQDSGSLYSLCLARDEINDDFLLLESDLIYEQRALTSAIEFPKDNCVLLSGFTNSGDEVFVELADGCLAHMSKNRSELGTISGELVGITKVSRELYSVLLDISDDLFVDGLKKDYETDGLVSAARRCPVYGHLVEDILWAEIDDPNHLERARGQVYPQISRVDNPK